MGRFLKPPLYIGVIMARLRSVGISPVFREALYSSWREWAINKPVNGVEMFILKQLEAIQKSFDSIMNCKYKNTTLENTLCIIKLN